MPRPQYTKLQALEDRVIKLNAENRMRVFDAAPQSVRDRANEKGEYVIEAWFSRLSSKRQHEILGTEPRSAFEMVFTEFRW